MQTRVTRFLERKEKNRGWNGSKIVHAKKKKISDRCSFTWNRVCQHVLPFLSPPLFCFLFPRKQLDREINFTWQSSNYRHIWPTKLPRINKVRQMFKYLMSWEKNEIKKKVKRKSGKVISEIKKKKKVNQRRIDEKIVPRTETQNPRKPSYLTRSSLQIRGLDKLRNDFTGLSPLRLRGLTEFGSLVEPCSCHRPTCILSAKCLPSSESTFHPTLRNFEPRTIPFRHFHGD